MQKIPYYKLKGEDRNIILDLIATCEKNGLGNVSFEYYNFGNSISFNLKQLKNEWQLTSQMEKKDRIGMYINVRDIYRITDDISFDYSEEEIL